MLVAVVAVVLQLVEPLVLETLLALEVAVLLLLVAME
jgi:hypothetical protein